MEPPDLPGLCGLVTEMELLPRSSERKIVFRFRTTAKGIIEFAMHGDHAMILMQSLDMIRKKDGLSVPTIYGEHGERDGMTLRNKK